MKRLPRQGSEQRGSSLGNAFVATKKHPSFPEHLEGGEGGWSQVYREEAAIKPQSASPSDTVKSDLATLRLDSAGPKVKFIPRLCGMSHQQTSGPATCTS